MDYIYWFRDSITNSRIQGIYPRDHKVLLWKEYFNIE